MIKFNHAVLRTARDHRVVPYNRISEDLNSTIEQSELERDGYGIVVSEKRNKAVMEIDEETALLLFTLQEPGKLPDHVLDHINPAVEHRIIDFILSGVIELEHKGQYISGQRAIELVSTEIDSESTMTSISHQAIRHVALLANLSWEEICRALYQYNVIPCSARRRKLLTDDKLFLNLAKMDNYWSMSEDMEGWYFFRHPQGSSFQCKAKLYISPLPDFLTQALHGTAMALKNHPHTSFKVGRGMNGVLRPDKLVVYFKSIDQLLAAAKNIEINISGLPSHCVPFTAAFTQDGLISWGMDPEKDTQGERKSWRQWIVEKLATFLYESQHQNTDASSTDDRCRLVLARLEQEGIDANTFRPRQLWINQYS